MKEIKVKIDKLCKEKGINQDMLIENIGMTRAGYYRMFDNESIKLKTIEFICMALNISLFDLLDEYFYHRYPELYKLSTPAHANPEVSILQNKYIRMLEEKIERLEQILKEREATIRELEKKRK